MTVARHTWLIRELLSRRGKDAHAWRSHPVRLPKLRVRATPSAARGQRETERIERAPQTAVAHVQCDIARGVSALVVFGAHLLGGFFFRFTGDETAFAIALGIAAQYAVLVFFLLSGYLITSTIVANIARFGSLDMIDYLCARVARIYPPLLGSIALTGMAYLAIRHFDLPGGRIPYGLATDLWRPREFFEFTSSDVVQALAMRGGLIGPNGALWSLYIEFSLYILAMGIAGVVSWPARETKAIGLAIAALAVVYGLRVNQNFMFFAAVWCLGSISFFLPAAILRSAALALIFPLALTFLISPQLFLVTRFDGPALAVRLGMALVCCALLFSVIWLSQLKSARLAATASFSYTLYVVHAPILMFAISISQNWIGASYLRSAITAAGSAVVVLAFTLFLARIFERPAFFKSVLLSAFLRKAP